MDTDKLSPQVLSVNQTLADALARKFVEVVGARAIATGIAAISAGVKVKHSPAGLVNAFTRMAKACYQQRMIFGFSLIDGRRSFVSSAQWDVEKTPSSSFGDMFVSMQHMRPKTGPVVSKAKISVKLHLLSRLFLRLNTIEHQAVLDELGPAIRLLLGIEMFCGFDWVFRTTGHDLEKDFVDIAVPSPNGLICGRLEPDGFHLITFVHRRQLSGEQIALCDGAFRRFPDLSAFGFELIHDQNHLAHRLAILDNHKHVAQVVGLESNDKGHTHGYVQVRGERVYSERTKVPELKDILAGRLSEDLLPRPWQERSYSYERDLSYLALAG